MRRGMRSFGGWTGWGIGLGRGLLRGRYGILLRVSGFSGGSGGEELEEDEVERHTVERKNKRRKIMRVLRREMDTKNLPETF
jgi:hypothetical protein